MVKIKQNWRFSRLERKLVKLNYLSAGLIYDVSVQTRAQKYHYIMMKINILVIQFELFYFTIFGPLELLSLISTIVPLSLGIAITSLALSIGNDKDRSTIIYNWIGTVPSRKPYFQTNRFKQEFECAQHYSILLLHFYACCFIFSVSMISVVFPGFRFLILNESFPLPAEKVHLPFLPPNNWLFFIINYVHQTYAVACLGLLSLITSMFYFAFLVHILSYFDAISVLVNNMQEAVEIESFKSWIKLVSIEFQELRK